MIRRLKTVSMKTIKTVTQALRFSKTAIVDCERPSNLYRVTRYSQVVRTPIGLRLGQPARRQIPVERG